MLSAIYPSLRDKQVVITGGASGIGATFVSAFAAQGAKVTFLDILAPEGHSLADALSHSPHPPVFIQTDLTNLDALTQALESVGTVDVLINNAANDDRHQLEDITPQFWDDRIAVNLRHFLFCAKAVVPGMKAKGSGAILNLGSISWHLGLSDLVIYETAKAGIEGMTRALARDLGPYGIRVTAIVPGNVSTPRQSKWYTPEAEEEIVSQQCMKSRLTPEHVAALALFLASDDACMCTGHEYWIDGGWR
jgi:NAD(P)-dependent dehydrogenase (short-subunit alcohol dehydrogenase family)